MKLHRENRFFRERATQRLGCVIALLTTHLTCCAVGQQTSGTAPLAWNDARRLTVEGKGWSDTKTFYDRLPARAEANVRPAVWNLSRDSAGLRVRFVTDATSISARWSLRNANLAMPHMTATGVSGLDLYVKDKDQWRWIGAGRPAAQTNEAVLVSGLKSARREFALYLPLYNGVTDVKIGVTGGEIFEPASPVPANVKPIVFYGTSIVQGGCATRPGMAYPAILGRRLNWPTVNLGFSGNAHSEPEIVNLLAELDPAIYVLDPLPNMNADMVAARMESFVKTLRETHPRTPIVLVENIEYANAKFVTEKRGNSDVKNVKLQEIHRRLAKAGHKGIFYVTSEKLIGDDGEGTVDGVHPTDLGFQRMADVLEPVLRRALKASR